MFQNLSPQIKSTLKNASSSLSDIVSEAVNLNLIGVIPLGVFSNTENNIAFALIRKLQLETKNGNTVMSEIVASNIVLKNGKVIILHAAKDSKSNSDLETLQNLLLHWGQKL